MRGTFRALRSICAGPFVPSWTKDRHAADARALGHGRSRSHMKAVGCLSRLSRSGLTLAAPAPAQGPVLCYCYCGLTTFPPCSEEACKTVCGYGGGEGGGGRGGGAAQTGTAAPWHLTVPGAGLTIRTKEGHAGWPSADARSMPRAATIEACRINDPSLAEGRRQPRGHLHRDKVRRRLTRMVRPVHPQTAQRRRQRLGIGSGPDLCRTGHSRLRELQAESRRRVRGGRPDGGSAESVRRQDVQRVPHVPVQSHRARRGSPMSVQATPVG